MPAYGNDLYSNIMSGDLTASQNTDEAHNVLSAFRFVLTVNGVIQVPCKSIRPFSKENEYEYIQEGGLNDYVHKVRKPASRPFTLVVERYVTGEITDPLPNGFDLTLPVMLTVYDINVRNSAIQRLYMMTGVSVINKEVGGLDAERSGLLTETVTLAYNHLYTLNNPY